MTIFCGALGKPVSLISHLVVDLIVLKNRAHRSTHIENRMVLHCLPNARLRNSSHFPASVGMD